MSDAEPVRPWLTRNVKVLSGVSLAQDAASEMFPHEGIGRVFGFHRAADTLGAVIGPLIGLVVLAAAGGDVRVALWVAVVPAVVSVLMVVLVTEERRRSRSQRRSGEARVLTPLPARVRGVAAVLALIALVNFPDALLLLRLN